MLDFAQKSPKKDQAFTLIELVVVISLISLLLFFSIPRLDISLFSDNKRKTSAWLRLTVRSLKQEAVRKQADLVLNLDMDEHQMWASTRQAAEAADGPEEMPRENPYQLPGGLRLTEVEFTEQERVTTGVARIHFYAKGYSDRALIRMEDDQDRRYAYHIEPFLLNLDIEIDER